MIHDGVESILHSDVRNLQSLSHRFTRNLLILTRSMPLTFPNQEKKNEKPFLKVETVFHCLRHMVNEFTP